MADKTSSEISNQGLLKEKYEVLRDEFNRVLELVQRYCPKPPLGHSVFEGIPLLAQRVKDLEAEVERLRNGEKEFTNHCQDCCCHALWEVLGNPPYEPNGGIVERVAKMKAEVERLKAHTWEQERKAVVAWLTNDMGTTRLPRLIERGEHWPEGGRG